MSLLSDTARLQTELQGFADDVAAIERRLDPFEAQDTRLARRRDKVDALRRRVLPRISDAVYALFGDAEVADPEGSFWTELGQAREQLARAKDRAIDADWTRIGSEAERLSAVVDGLVSVGEARELYESGAFSERVAWWYHADLMLGRLGADREASRSFRSQLRREFAAHVEAAPSVVRAMDKIAQVESLRVTAYQLLLQAVAALGADDDGVRFRDPNAVASKSRIDAQVHCDALSGEMSWTFALRPVFGAVA